jgi:hypothetical protein
LIGDLNNCFNSVLPSPPGRRAGDEGVKNGDFDNNRSACDLLMGVNEPGCSVFQIPSIAPPSSGLSRNDGTRAGCLVPRSPRSREALSE